MTPATSTLVVPCYEEVARLDLAGLLQLVDEAGVALILVDDGSADGTLERLRSIAAARPGSIDVIARGRNGGKAEAVRAGLRAALATDCALVGYFDADFATPPLEVARLVAVARDRPDLDVVLGSRVALLGHRIRRSGVRHYCGRVFATVSSLVLGLPVYDTQCGAKVFRATPALRAAVSTPFVSRWAFDVELLDRLVHTGHGVPAIAVEAMVEVPLREWSDVSGSKLNAREAIRAALDLGRLAVARRRRSS